MLPRTYLEYIVGDDLRGIVALLEQGVRYLKGQVQILGETVHDILNGKLKIVPIEGVLLCL